MTTNKKFIYFFVLVTSLYGLQCKSTSNLALEKIYVDQFKLTYFRQMLNKGYNNSEAIQEIISTDHSGDTEPILAKDDYILIDSLTSVDNENMRIDSIEGDRRAEGAQGKRPLRFILNKLTSKWLDSLAIKRYNISGVKELLEQNFTE